MPRALAEQRLVPRPIRLSTAHGVGGPSVVIPHLEAEALTAFRLQRPTVCVTGAGVGVDSAWEQEKLEARKMPVNRAESPASSARFVGRRFANGFLTCCNYF